MSEKKESTGTTINVTGGIHAGRDVIQGDQINITHQQIANIETPQAFLDELRALQSQIAALKQLPQATPQDRQTLEVVEGQIATAIEEAQKPKPLGARIQATLTGAKASMALASDTIKAAAGLGATLAGLIEIAIKLFGG